MSQNNPHLPPFTSSIPHEIFRSSNPFDATQWIRFIFEISARKTNYLTCKYRYGSKEKNTPCSFRFRGTWENVKIPFTPMKLQHLSSKLLDGFFFSSENGTEVRIADGLGFVASSRNWDQLQQRLPQSLWDVPARFGSVEWTVKHWGSGAEVAWLPQEKNLALFGTGCNNRLEADKVLHRNWKSIWHVFWVKGC